MKKNILTIATGKEIYINLALNLFRSFLHWHETSDICFYLVTDRPDLIPTDFNPRLKILSYEEGSIGKGFYPKICLDRFAPSGQTIFIDSDCLIFENLAWIFEKFKGKKVSVVGGYIEKGEWFGDIEKICKTLDVEKLPKFNGGVYYLEQGPEATKVYETAREIEKKYDEIGFVRFRGFPADELIMASAMALNDQHPIPDEGVIMSDPLACQGEYSIDAISGYRFLTNPPMPHPLHQPWYPFTIVKPAIVHFLGFYTEEYPYKREAYRLKKSASDDLNVVTELVSKLRYEWPDRAKITFKDIFRPIFRALFGYRKINKSDRLN